MKSVFINLSFGNKTALFVQAPSFSGGKRQDVQYNIEKTILNYFKSTAIKGMGAILCSFFLIGKEASFTKCISD